MTSFFENVYHIALDCTDSIAFMLCDDNVEKSNILFKYHDWMLKMQSKLRSVGKNSLYESAHEKLLIIVQFCFRVEFDFLKLTMKWIDDIIDLSNEILEKWLNNEEISCKTFVEERIKGVFKEETVTKVVSSAYDYRAEYMIDNPFVYTNAYAEALSNKSYIESRETDIVYNIYKLGQLMDDCDDEEDYKEYAKKLQSAKDLYNEAKQAYQDMTEVFDDEDLSLTEKGKLFYEGALSKYQKVFPKLACLERIE